MTPTALPEMTRRARPRRASGRRGPWPDLSGEGVSSGGGSHQATAQAGRFFHTRLSVLAGLIPSRFRVVGQFEND